MSKGLNFDGPFMHALDTIANLLALNFLTVICSLPVFTFGAAYTALHRQLYKMKADEEGYIVRGFFREFKRNFRQATILWLTFLGVGMLLGTDVYIFIKKGLGFSSYYKIAIYAICFAACLCFVYVFPIVARYETTNKNVLKNAFAMAVYAFPKSILMVAVTVVPWVGALYNQTLLLLDLLFGISLPAYICVFLYGKTFAVFERKQAEAEEDHENGGLEPDGTIQNKKENKVR